MPPKRKYSLAEAVAAVNEDNDEEFGGLSEAIDFVTEEMDVDIVLLPPTTVDSQSDEEDIDDDNLLPSQLPREVPGTVAVHVRSTGSNSSPVTKTTGPPPSKKKSVALPKWSKNVSFTKVISSSSESLIAKQEQMKNDPCDKTPYELFRLL